MANFPGSTPSFAGFTSSHTLAQDSHASQHNQEQAEIIALANKIGTGASTPASNLVLRGTDVGTSAWSQVNLTSDVTGVLPQANGGTGTTLATGTGKAVYDTTPTISGAQLTSSPTLATPIIASFTNATHSHQNATGGGTLGAAAVPSLDLSIQTLSNPYKFSAYRVAAQNVGTAATKVVFDTEEVDSDNDFSGGTYTVRVAGTHQINFTVACTAAGTGTNIEVLLYKNGSPVWHQFVDAGAGNSPGVTHAKDYSLAVNDTLEVYVATGVAAKALDVTLLYNNSFSGHLVSQT